MRGRIAKMVAISKILAGSDAEALHAFRTYEANITMDRYSRILKIGAANGRVGWKAICILLRFREWLKSLAIFLSAAARRGKH